jgi:hypothetical protein
MDWKQLLISMLNGFFGVFFAGVVLWLFQYHYTERTHKAKKYIDRRQMEEDEFFQAAKAAKHSFYLLNRLIIFDPDEMTESTAYKIGNSLQSALDFLVCNRTVLRKYEEPMKGIYVNYNSFMNTLREVQHGKLSIETDTKEGKEMRLKLDEFKNNIFRYFNEIDELYFIQKKEKSSDNTDLRI